MINALSSRAPSRRKSLALSPQLDRGSMRFAAALLVLFVTYYLSGKFGLSLAFVHSNATAVWPPTGLALAALLVGGLRLWPAVFVGAFLVNISTAGSWATSLGIA